MSYRKEQLKRQNTTFIFSQHDSVYFWLIILTNKVFPMQQFVKGCKRSLQVGVCPITITPNVKGHWTWITTQIIEFKPFDSFPKATAFTVFVPQGLESSLGTKLEENVHFTISTETLLLLNHFPKSNTKNISFSHSGRVVTFTSNSRFTC